MTKSFGEDINAVLAANAAIDRDTVLSWIEGASDLKTMSKLYRLTGEGYYRIQPELGLVACCALIQRYLLECIKQNVTGDDEVFSRWDAADTLHIWFRHLLGMENTSVVVSNAAKAITDLFLASGKEVRDAIEMGFLEHALETAALRPYFENWSSNPQLREAWDDASEWGKAHPDYMWNLLQQIPRPDKE